MFWKTANTLGAAAKTRGLFLGELRWVNSQSTDWKFTANEVTSQTSDKKSHPMAKDIQIPDKQCTSNGVHGQNLNKIAYN